MKRIVLIIIAFIISSDTLRAQSFFVIDSVEVIGASLYSELLDSSEPYLCDMLDEIKEKGPFVRIYGRIINDSKHAFILSGNSVDDSLWLQRVFVVLFQYQGHTYKTDSMTASERYFSYVKQGRATISNIDWSIKYIDASEKKDWVVEGHILDTSGLLEHTESKVSGDYLREEDIVKMIVPSLEVQLGKLIVLKDNPNYIKL